MKFRYSRQFVIFSALTLLWTAVIFLFSAQNGEESSGLSARLLAFLCGLFRYEPAPETRSLLTLLLRKAAHMTEFGILALLWLGTLRSGFGKSRRHYLLAFAAASFCGAADECHQLFVSGSAGQFTDWLIDSAGALLFLTAAGLLSAAVAFARRKREKP